MDWVMPLRPANLAGEGRIEVLCSGGYSPSKRSISGILMFCVARNCVEHNCCLILCTYQATPQVVQS